VSTSKTNTQSVRLAVAQTSLRTDPGDAAGFVAAGREIRSLMSLAHERGADLIQFPETALCSPAKRRVSSDPDHLAEADWSKFEWSAQQAELDKIADEAGRLGLWTVVGALHAASDPTVVRPRISLYVFDHHGNLHARYDERLLSATKRTYLYEAGDHPTSFKINNVRFGCAAGLEVLFPELFSDYEAAGVDCVLFSTGGPGSDVPDSLVRPALNNAHLYEFWVTYSSVSDSAPHAAAGIIAPGGEWAARCSERPEPALAVAEIGPRPQGAGQDWHREMITSYRSQRAHAAR